MPKKYYTLDKTGQEVEVDSALASQLVKSGKKKPEDFTVEELPYDKPDFSTKMRGLAASLRRDREQAQAQAAQESFDQQPWYNKLLTGMGKTFASTPGIQQIAEFSTGEEIDPSDFEAYERGAQGSALAGTGEVLGDLALTAYPATKAFQGARGMLKGASKPLQALAGGGGAGVASAGIHQAQNIQEGQGFSPTGATFETGASMLMPYAGSKLAGSLKEGATRIIQTASKLGRKIKGQKVMNPKQVQNYFDNYASWRGMTGSEKMLNKHQDILGRKFDDLMGNISKGKQVNVSKALKDSRTRVQRLMNTGQINLSEAPMVLKQIDDFEEMVKPLMNKKGLVFERDFAKFKSAQRIKQRTLDEMAKWDKASPTGNYDPALSAQAQAARETRGKLLSQMTEVEPSMKPINLEYRQMADVRPFIREGAERVRANRGLSLQDLMTGSMALANPKSIPAFLISRAQKSPAMAKTLWELSRMADDPGVLGQTGMQTGRSLYNLYGE